MLAKKFKLPIGTFPRQGATLFEDSNLALRGVKNNLTHNRVGIVFRKGAFKTAVLRNKMKRNVFDFFRINWRDLGTQGLDLLVTLKPAIIGLNVADYLKNNNVNFQRNITSAIGKRISPDL